MVSKKQGLSFNLSPKTEKVIKPLYYTALPPVAYISLKQHLGPMATLVVEKGQTVQKGQVLARSSHPTSADIHSPAPGIIKNISTQKQLTKGLVTLIELETGGKYNLETPKQQLTVAHLSRDFILASLKNAGLVEVGTPNPLPLFTLLQKNQTTHLVINAVINEPFTYLNRTLLHYTYQELAKGVAIVAHLLNPQNILIAINESFKAEAEALQNCLLEEGLAVHFMPCYGLVADNNPYLLTEKITGKPTNLNHNLVESPVAILSLNSLLLIYRTIFYNEPHLQHVVSISGDGVKEKKVMVTCLGTPISFLLEECGGFSLKRTKSIVAGSVLKGFNLVDENTPITKEIEQITVLTKKQINKASTTECSMCNLCIKACPRGLHANKLYQALSNQRYDLSYQLHLERCLLCGACSYICPSRLPLSALFSLHTNTNLKENEGVKF